MITVDAKLSERDENVPCLVSEARWVVSGYMAFACSLKVEKTKDE